MMTITAFALITCAFIAVTAALQSKLSDYKSRNTELENKIAKKDREIEALTHEKEFLQARADINQDVKYIDINTVNERLRKSGDFRE